MRTHWTTLIIGLLALPAWASNNYQTLPIERDNQTVADVMEVELLSSRVLVEAGKFGNYENRSVEVVLGVKAVASSCERMTTIHQLVSQTSLTSGLNPSDFYVRIHTLWKKGCVTGSFGAPEYIRFPLKFHVDQRPVTESGKPWPVPKFTAKSQYRHYSFYSGMMQGFNRWKMYKLDYSDLSQVEFDFVKEYSYVEGQVINH